jgi:hypothetical protein
MQQIVPWQGKRHSLCRRTAAATLGRRSRCGGGYAPLILTLSNFTDILSVVSNIRMSLSGVVLESGSGGCFRSIKNGFEENRACVVKPLRSQIIAHCHCLRIEVFEGDVGLEELFWFWRDYSA